MIKQTLLLAILLASTSLLAQTVPQGKAETAPVKTTIAHGKKAVKGKTPSAKATDKIATAYQPPVEVQGTFESEFPTIKPTWRKDFGGVNKDEPRFVADFTMQGDKVAAYYNAQGVQKLLMRSTPVARLPATVTKYLQLHYPTFKIVAAAKVKNENNTYTLEVGIQDKTTFYDTVFDTDGNFLVVRKK